MQWKMQLWCVPYLDGALQGDENLRGLDVAEEVDGVLGRLCGGGRLGCSCYCCCRHGMYVLNECVEMKEGVEGQVNFKGYLRSRLAEGVW
jgi:hypothetical protein